MPPEPLPGNPTGLPVVVVLVPLCPWPVEGLVDGGLGADTTGVTVGLGFDWDRVGFEVAVVCEGDGVAVRVSDAVRWTRSGASGALFRECVVLELASLSWLECELGRPGSEPNPPRTPRASAISQAASSATAATIAARPRCWRAESSAAKMAVCPALSSMLL